MTQNVAMHCVREWAAMLPYALFAGLANSIVSTGSLGPHHPPPGAWPDADRSPLEVFGRMPDLTSRPDLLIGPFFLSRRSHDSSVRSETSPAMLHSRAPIRLVVPVDCAKAGSAHSEARPHTAKRKIETDMGLSTVEANVPQPQSLCEVFSPWRGNSLHSSGDGNWIDEEDVLIGQHRQSRIEQLQRIAIAEIEHRRPAIVASQSLQRCQIGG